MACIDVAIDAEDRGALLGLTALHLCALLDLNAPQKNLPCGWRCDVTCGV